MDNGGSNHIHIYAYEILAMYQAISDFTSGYNFIRADLPCSCALCESAYSIGWAFALNHWLFFVPPDIDTV